MSALREVFARFSTRFDDRALKRGARTTEGLTSKLRTMGGVILGGLGVHALKGFVTDLAALGDELDKTSKVIGISVADLQEWRHAANLSGVGAEQFNGGVVRLQRMMLDSTRGVKTATDAFGALGVQVTDSSGNLKSVDQVLTEMADPLANLESDSERVGLLMQLMGRSGARMGPLFANGAEGVREMRAEVAELGGGASQEFVDDAAHLTDEMARLDLAFLSVKSRIGTALLPAIENITDAFAWMARNAEVVGAVLGSIATGLIVGKLIPALKAMGIAGMRANLMAFGTWVAIGASIALVFLLIQDFFGFLEGKDSFFQSFAESTNDWLDATKEGSGVWATIAGWMASARDSLTDMYSTIFGGTPDEDEFTSDPARRGLQSPQEARAALEARGIDVDAERAGFAPGQASVDPRRRLVAPSVGMRAGEEGIFMNGRMMSPRQVSRERGGQGIAQNIEVQVAVEASGMSPEQARTLINDRLQESFREALEDNAPGVE